MDPGVVRRTIAHLMPIWECVDTAEANRLSDALGSSGPPSTKAELAKKLRNRWPGTSQYEINSDLFDHNLALAVLSPNAFLPWLRFAEEEMLDEGSIAGSIIYWSRTFAGGLLPGGVKYRELIRDSYCVSIFSENRSDFDEWAVVAETMSLCFIVFGTQDDRDIKKKFEVVDPRFIDNHDNPDPARVPRRPLPFKFDTGVALPEPPPEGGA